jgi:hypothetical protein
MVDQNKTPVEPSKPVGGYTKSDISERVSQQTALLKQIKNLIKYNIWEADTPYTVIGETNKPVTSGKFIGERGVDAASSSGDTFNFFRTPDLSSGKTALDILNQYTQMRDGVKAEDWEVLDFLESLTPLQTSFLMPYVTLTKVISKGGETYENIGYSLKLHQGNFDQQSLGDNQKLKSFFNGDRETLGGFGVEEISMKQVTSQEANFSFSKFMVDVSVKFNSIEDMLTPLKDTRGQSYTPIEVLVGLEKMVTGDNNDPFTYLLLLEMGYFLDESLMGTFFPDYTKEKLDLIFKKINFKLFMSLINYDLDLKQTGQANVKCHYVGWNQLQQAHDSTDVLRYPVIQEEAMTMAPVDEEKVYGIFMERIFMWSKLLNASCSPNMFNAAKYNPAAPRLGTLATANTNSITGAVVQDGRLFNPPDEEFVVTSMRMETDGNKEGKLAILKGRAFYRKSIKKSGELAKELTGKKGTDKIQTATLKDISEVKDSLVVDPILVSAMQRATTDTKRINIPFVFLSDLVTALLAGIYDNFKLEYFKGFNVALEVKFGEVRILDPQNPGTKEIPNFIYVSIGDIPISFELFTVWFNRNVVKKQRTVYKFAEFIEDTCRDLISYSLNSAYYDSHKAILDTVNNFKIGAFTDISLSQVEGKKNNINFLVYIYASEILGDASAQAQKKATGDRELDKKNGVVWLSIGKDKGLIKNIKFSKATSQMLRSSMVVKTNTAVENPDGAKGFNSAQRLSQMREIYNVELNLLGNALLQPARVVCVQPSLLGVGNINDINNVTFSIFGIGGYYTIIDTGIVFKAGKFETNLKGVWAGVPIARERLGRPNATTGDKKS